MNKIDNEELDRLIEEAVFENGARKRLQALENTIRREERQARARRRVLWIAGGAVSAAAAVVAAVVVFSSPTAEQVQRGIELSEKYITTDETYRDIIGDSDIEKQINNAKEELAAGNYKECRKLLSDVKHLVQQVLADKDCESISELERLSLVQISDKADWYITISWLKQGKPQKAKRMLCKIASGNGVYADDAQALLRELYN